MWCVTPVPVGQPSCKVPHAPVVHIRHTVPIIVIVSLIRLLQNRTAGLAMQLVQADITDDGLGVAGQRQHTAAQVAACTASSTADSNPARPPAAACPIKVEVMICGTGRAKV